MKKKFPKGSHQEIAQRGGLKTAKIIKAGQEALKRLEKKECDCKNIDCMCAEPSQDPVENVLEQD
jgi:hypothetical protein